MGQLSRSYSVGGHEWTEYDGVHYDTNEATKEQIRAIEDAKTPYKEKFFALGKSTCERLAEAGYTPDSLPFALTYELVHELYRELYPTNPVDEPWMRDRNGNCFRDLFYDSFLQGFQGFSV